LYWTLVRVVLACLVLCVIACREQRPPEPTAEQSGQLNEADALLNQMANEEGPETNAPGPSNSSD
jgi:hypothetical protein